MKVFCDTNIVLEFLFKRKEAETIVCSPNILLSET